MRPVLATLRRAARLLRSPTARIDAVHEWRRTRGGEPSLPASRVEKILVLCHGNICRSPFAAAVLAARRPGLEVASAGFEAGRDARADALATKVASEFGVRLDSHRSRRVDATAIERADLVLVMQAHQVRLVHALSARSSARGCVYLLGDFLDSAPFALLDPWGRSEEVFRQVFGRIDRAAGRLSDRLAEGSP